MIDKSTNKIGVQLFPGRSILYHLIKRSTFKCLRIIFNAMPVLLKYCNAIIKGKNNKNLIEDIVYMYLPGS